MGRKPVQNKKTPGDFPQFAFRVPEGTNKADLINEIEGIQKLLNKRSGPGQRFINKNDVIVSALKIGLRELKKRG